MAGIRGGAGTRSPLSPVRRRHSPRARPRAAAPGLAPTPNPAPSPVRGTAGKIYSGESRNPASAAITSGLSALSAGRKWHSRRVVKEDEIPAKQKETTSPSRQEVIAPYAHHTAAHR